jgi:hypothetical protein
LWWFRLLQNPKSLVVHWAESLNQFCNFQMMKLNAAC